MKKYAYIDLLRGLAILGVVGVHSSQAIPNLSGILSAGFNYGQLGVQLFFVASAITLCMSMANRNESSITSFYIRRFFRIAPLFYCALVFYFLWRLLKAYAMGRGLTIPEEYSFAGLIQTISFVHGFSLDNFNYFVPGGWSISAEMAFYAVFPFLYTYTKGYSNKELVALSIKGILVLGAIQAVFIYLFVPFILDKSIANNGFGFLYASIFNQFGVFLIGIVSFRYLNVRLNTSAYFIVLLLTILAVLIQSLPMLKFGMNGYIYPLISALSFSILAVLLSSINFGDSKVFNYFTELGQNSFSIYICHFFVLDIIRFLFAKVGLYEDINPNIMVFIILISTLIISKFISSFTLKYVELPGINLGKNVNLKYLNKNSMRVPL